MDQDIKLEIETTFDVEYLNGLKVCLLNDIDVIANTSPKIKDLKAKLVNLTVDQYEAQQRQAINELMIAVDARLSELESAPKFSMTKNQLEAIIKNAYELGSANGGTFAYNMEYIDNNELVDIDSYIQEVMDSLIPKA